MAEGPGAELSVRYQKVSVCGAVSRWPGGSTGGNQLSGTSGGADRARGNFCPFLVAAPRVSQPPGSFAGMGGLQLAFHTAKEAI